MSNVQGVIHEVGTGAVQLAIHGPSQWHFGLRETGCKWMCQFIPLAGITKIVLADSNQEVCEAVVSRAGKEDEEFRLTPEASTALLDAWRKHR